MNKKTLQEMVRLTQECLARYWQLDAEFVIGHFDKDVLWVGAVQDQYKEGFEQSAEDLRRSLLELKPCHLLHQEFSVVQNVGNACTVAGRYLTTTDDEVGYFLQVMQRCTFVWELVDGVPKIKHIHVSNPMGELRLADGELFPDALGQMSKQYWNDRWRSVQGKKRIAVKDRDDVVHFLSPSEVLYVMADGRNSVIRTMSAETIRARPGRRELLAELGEGFIAVHRSYALNSAYVSSIRKYEVIMTDGSKIPIPERRYKEVRERLTAVEDRAGGEAGDCWQSDRSGAGERA